MEFGIDELKGGLSIFVVSEYQNSSIQLLENEEHNLDTCSRRNVLTFPCTKQYKAVHDKLTAKHLFPGQT